MTTIVIDLYNNQWIGLLIAFLLGGGFFCLLIGPFIYLNGYEKRGGELAEEVEVVKRYQERNRG